MGDVILRVQGGDFSTSQRNSGWRGLVEWCLRLDAAVRKLAESATSIEMSLPDSSEFIQIRRQGDDLLFSCTYADTQGRTETAAFVEHAERFIRESVEWIGANYPAAKRNAETQDIWERLDAYLAK